MTGRLEVWKFGGASLADAHGIRRAVGLITAHQGPLVVVASALYGITDLLLGGGQRAVSGDAAGGERAGDGEGRGGGDRTLSDVHLKRVPPDFRGLVRAEPYGGARTPSSAAGRNPRHP